MKVCSKCNKEKELTDFSKNKSSKDGLYPSCKSCVKEYNKEYCKANADKIKEKKREYRKTKANKIKKYHKEYYKANADKFKKYRKANADKMKEYNKTNADNFKEYRKANADKIKKYHKEYQKEYYRERRKTDPLFKLSGSIRCLILGSFKRGINNFTKSERTEEILGCSIMFFQTYIKGQFKKGMTLENHGEWHLDHIKPIASATTKKQVIDLNHYTNFQPLWAKDNISKSDKIIEKQLKLL